MIGMSLADRIAEENEYLESMHNELSDSTERYLEEITADFDKLVDQIPERGQEKEKLPQNHKTRENPEKNTQKETSGPAAVEKAKIAAAISRPAIHKTTQGKTLLSQIQKNLFLKKIPEKKRGIHRGEKEEKKRKGTHRKSSSKGREL